MSVNVCLFVQCIYRAAAGPCRRCRAFLVLRAMIQLCRAGAALPAWLPACRLVAAYCRRFRGLSA